MHANMFLNPTVRTNFIIFILYGLFLFSANIMLFIYYRTIHKKKFLDIIGGVA